MTGNVLKKFARQEKTFRRLLILILLYLIPVFGSMKPVIDPDLWWHLRTGQWIIGHGAVPWTDPFSIYGAGKSWIAYSWLFEILVYGFYQSFGLIGILLFTITLSLIIAVALHALVRRFEPRFVPAAAITALGLGAMVPLMNPRPWLFSILFFIIEIDILLEVRQTGRTRRLLLLPPLFLIWANTHIQVVYGLFVLGIAASELLAERFLHCHMAENRPNRPIADRRVLVMAACFLATLATPYHLYLYRTLWELILQTAPYSYSISDLVSLQFRSPADWLVLALTLGAAFFLGRRREIRPFPFLLIAAGAFLSFRARRDAWFVVIAAVSILATSHCLSQMLLDRFAVTRLRGLILAGAVLIGVVGVGWFQDISPHNLNLAVAKLYPAAAAAEVEKRGYAGPLYNSFGWGGYLIWRLPDLPVSMDGRTNLHGDDRVDRNRRTWAGVDGWDSDPELIPSRLVIADTTSALSSLLSLDERFELVYEDPVATVFTRRP
jgi:hypothetical protein